MNHAQDEFQTPSELRDRAFPSPNLEILVIPSRSTAQYRPPPSSSQTQNGHQLSHKMELEALLLAFVSTHGTYLVVQYDDITPTDRRETADSFFEHFSIHFRSWARDLDPAPEMYEKCPTTGSAVSL